MLSHLLPPTWMQKISVSRQNLSKAEYAPCNCKVRVHLYENPPARAPLFEAPRTCSSSGTKDQALPSTLPFRSSAITIPLFGVERVQVLLHLNKCHQLLRETFLSLQFCVTSAMADDPELAKWRAQRAAQLQGGMPGKSGPSPQEVEQQRKKQEYA